MNVFFFEKLNSERGYWVTFYGEKNKWKSPEF